MWIVYVVLCYVDCLFFFFKQKTADEMRISDWSSDVCSSDLQLVGGARPITLGLRAPDIGVVELSLQPARRRCGAPPRRLHPFVQPAAAAEIGRASCRERVCQYV